MHVQTDLTNPSKTQAWSFLAKYLRAQRFKVFLLGLLLFGGVGLQLAMPQITRRFIDAAQAGSNLEGLSRLALVFLAVATVKYLVSLGTTYVGEDVGWTATNELRADLTAHCLELDMSFHNTHTPGALIERVDGDVGLLANFFSQMFLRAISNVLVLSGVLVVLSLEDWRLGLAFFGFTLVVLLLLGTMRGTATEDLQAQRQASANLFGFMEERLSGTEDIRANAGSRYTLRQLFVLMHDLRRKDILAWMKIARLRTTTFALFSFGGVLALFLSTWLFQTGSITIGMVYLIYAYVQMIASPIERLALDAQDFQYAAASLHRVSRLLSTSSRVMPPLHGQALEPEAIRLEFQQVSFAYDQRQTVPDAAGAQHPDEQQDTIVLNNISFQLRPGHVLGVLGRTGSGKTTIARLALRLYDPRSGNILLNGTDLRSIALPELRRRVGVVTQDVQLFQATVRDNLTLFDPAIGDEKIIEVIEELGIGQWYRSLPDGLNTELAAGGGSLSAGQAQLLAFARVFLRDPGLVILDEASSRLDPATERLIERGIDRLLRGRTAIIIAHRLATLERADEVLLLHNGSVMEYGSRAELVEDRTSLFTGLLQRGLQEELA